MKITKIFVFILFSLFIIGCSEEIEVKENNQTNRLFNNSKPIFLSKGPYLVKENTTEAFQIKAKNSNKLKYYLSKKDFHLLYVDIISGEVFFNKPTNYKRKSKYEVNAIIQDPLGNSGMQEVLINVKKSNNHEFVTPIHQDRPLHNYHHNEYFITTWKTDNIGVSNSNQITIPTIGDGYNYSVDWGDGTSSRRLSGDITHTYSKAGIYTVKIVGDFPRIYFSKDYYRQDEKVDNDAKKLLSVEQWGKTKWVSMGGAFAGCSNMRVNSSDTPDLSDVTDMHYMFYQASNFNQNIEDWNVSNVKNMRGLLYEASSFNQSLASWNVSEATNMSNMLAETSISIDNYDDILNGWSNQTLQENVDFSIGDVPYSNNSSEARENIEERYNWEIIDGNITNNKDITQPVITLLGKNPIVLTVGDTYIDAGATATDNIDKDLTKKIIKTSTVDTSKSGTYTVTYIVYDNAGNKARVHRTVIVNEISNTKPIIKLIGKPLVNLNVGEIYTDEGATAHDKEDGDISTSIIIDNPVNTSIPSIYTITYNVIDSDNNKATEVTRTVSVSNLVDTIKPTIKLIGNNNITITQNEPYTDAGATAQDNKDGDITDKIIINNPVDTSKLGTYIITYNVSDVAGNKANEVIRTITIKKPIDTEAPILKLNGQDNIFITLNSIYKEQGATVTDNIDKDLKITITGNVDTTTLGVYTISYSAVDSANNKGTITRTVNVVDTSKPIITLLGQSPIDIALGKIYIDAGAIAQDKEDGDITKNIKTSNLVNTNKIGKYTVTYNVSDTAGNKANKVTRIVNVIDSTKPIITLIGENPITIIQNEAYTDAGATASDNIDGDISTKIKTVNPVDTSKVGTYTVTYNVSDNAGNQAEEITRTVNVKEKIIEPDYATKIDLSQTDFGPGDTPVTITLKVNELLGGTNSGDLELTLSKNDHFNLTMDSNSNWEVSDSQAIYRFKYIKNNGKYTPNTESTITLTGTFHLDNGSKGSFPMTIGVRSGSGDKNSDNNEDSKQVTYDSEIETITRRDPHTHSNCLGYIEKSGKDNNRNGILDNDEITSSIPIYEEGIPITLTELKDKIAKEEDVTEVNTCEITYMGFLFLDNTNFNQDISKWNVGSVTNMRNMFYKASNFNQDISSWDVSNVTNMSTMFHDALNFNQNIGLWNVSNVTNMDSMFHDAHAFNQNIGSWDVSKVTNMESMFFQANAFNQDISLWNVSNVTNMNSMFISADAFNQDISLWDVSNVTNMSSMFNSTPFNQDISSWDVSNVTSMDSMFNGAKAFNQDISVWDVSKVTNMRWMFYRAENFNQNISSWNVSNIINMYGMFWNAKKFHQDISSWDVSNVTNMGYMFNYAKSFKDHDLSSWDVSKVTEHDKFLTGAGTGNTEPIWNE